MTCGCHGGDSKTANNFLLRSALSQERQVKMYKPVFMVISACHRLFPEIWGLPPLSLVGAKDKIPIYIIKVNFSKKLLKGR
jgi:hypothetical protein